MLRLTSRIQASISPGDILFVEGDRVVAVRRIEQYREQILQTVQRLAPIGATGIMDHLGCPRGSAQRNAVNQTIHRLQYEGMIRRDAKKLFVLAEPDWLR